MIKSALWRGAVRSLTQRGIHIMPSIIFIWISDKNEYIPDFDRGVLDICPEAPALKIRESFRCV